MFKVFLFVDVNTSLIDAYKIHEVLLILVSVIFIITLSFFPHKSGLVLIGFKLKLIVGVVVNKFILENSKLNGMVYDVFIIFNVAFSITVMVP